MVIFYSYVKLPEGRLSYHLKLEVPYIRPIDIRPKFQGISPEKKKVKHMVRLRTSILGS